MTGVVQSLGHAKLCSVCNQRGQVARFITYLGTHVFIEQLYEAINQREHKLVTDPVTHFV
ncbi:hypothetical protein PSECIP111951_00560 [Pseudoalteromonas holothuriae]|uniref:Uncharacterized protein n=1 Tax=Pseudoalteromonas holothuriae TaxID=2963714 RepID=A0ABN8ULF6_9GAMM|nr:hypothetical protein PSECIP111951_00560 [Pseudoalteromonas sp. CIP111951]